MYKYNYHPKEIKQYSLEDARFIVYEDEREVIATNVSKKTSLRQQYKRGLSNH